MDYFKKKNIIEQFKMDKESLYKYYRDLRKYEYEHKDFKKGIEIRKKIFPLLQKLIKLSVLLDRQKLTTLNNKSTIDGKPKIYCVTHIGRYDIENSLIGVNGSRYFLWGDPEELYLSFDRLVTELLGTIFVETDNKQDRALSYKTMKKIIESGGSVQIYPEGAWNLLSNMPVMKVFAGAIKLSMETGAEIIPIAIDQDGKSYVINIGSNIKFEEDTNIDDARDYLRTVLATLKWEIWEQKGIFKRSDIKETEEEYIHEIMKYSDIGYTEEVIERSRYKDIGEVSYDEVFSSLGNIEMNKDNLFLFEGTDNKLRKTIAKQLQKRY